MTTDKKHIYILFNSKIFKYDINSNYINEWETIDHTHNKIIASWVEIYEFISNDRIINVYSNDGKLIRCINKDDDILCFDENNNYIYTIYSKICKIKFLQKEELIYYQKTWVL